MTISEYYESYIEKGEHIVIVLGDVHRRWEEAARAIDRAGLYGRTIIQVGDFGLGFGDLDRERQQVAALGAALYRRRNRLLIVRGNHDNPALFRAPTELAGGAIRLTPDYSLETVEGRKVLLVGGAISVDRRLRRVGRSYWPDEAFVLDLTRLAALDLSDLDAVITHTAPGVAPPPLDRYNHFIAIAAAPAPSRYRAALQRLYTRDETLADDVGAERRALDALYRAIRTRTAIPHWIYGHFHHHATAVYEDTRFTALSKLQMLEIGKR